MTVLRYALTTFRVQIIAYGFGLGAYAALIALLYPSLADTMSELEDSYPPGILDAFSGGAALSLASAEGFFTLEFFSLAPVIFAIFAVFASTAVLAGEESSGTLEFLGALPLSRRHLFFQKTLALLIAIAAIAAITSLGWAITIPAIELEGLTLVALIGATFAQVSFVAFVAAAGLLLGALAPTRGTAAALTGGVTVVAYLATTIAGAVSAASWVKYVSPLYYADFPAILVEGITPWHFAVLWLATVGRYRGGRCRSTSGRSAASRWQCAG